MFLENMVQYGVMPNCTNRCDFCLRLEQQPISIADIIKRINHIKYNLDYVDWQGKFSRGISLLGGEIYGLIDQEYQLAFLSLIDDIITKVLKSNKREIGWSKYSTVTNGIYDPSFLFMCCDKIIQECGICVLDVNFSYDLKYRYKDETTRLLVLENINKFSKRYNYKTGVQMILTQYVIDSIFSGIWNIKKFIEDDIPGNQLVFLYPHPIHTGKILNDFFFKRKDFLNFLIWLEFKFPDIYNTTVSSIKYSGTFKHTGLFDPNEPADQSPRLADGKEILQEKCGHSILYNCYSDSNKCMLCDIQGL